MINPGMYQVLKKFTSDPEWPKFEEFVDEEVRKITNIFQTTPDADLKSLQIRAMELRRLKGYIHQSIREYEERGSSK